MSPSHQNSQVNWSLCKNCELYCLHPGLPGLAFGWGWCCLPSDWWATATDTDVYYPSLSLSFCFWLSNCPIFLSVLSHNPPQSDLLFEWKGSYLLPWLFSFSIPHVAGSCLLFYPWGPYCLFILRFYFLPSYSGCPSLSSHTKYLITSIAGHIWHLNIVYPLNFVHFQCQHRQYCPIMKHLIFCSKLNTWQIYIFQVPSSHCLEVIWRFSRSLPLPRRQTLWTQPRSDFQFYGHMLSTFISERINSAIFKSQVSTFIYWIVFVSN